VKKSGIVRKLNGDAQYIRNGRSVRVAFFATLQG
jgi:hypothetical protein